MDVKAAGTVIDGDRGGLGVQQGTDANLPALAGEEIVRRGRDIGGKIKARAAFVEKRQKDAQHRARLIGQQQVQGILGGSSQLEGCGSARFHPKTIRSVSEAVNAAWTLKKKEAGSVAGLQGSFLTFWGIRSRSRRRRNRRRNRSRSRRSRRRAAGWT